MLLTGRKDFTPAPEGNHVGVLVDFEELGPQPTKFGVKEMVKLVYQIDEKMENDDGTEGEPFIVSSRFNATIADRSSLRKHLVGLRGKDFTEDELIGFDPENLIGLNALLSIKHKTTEKGTFANIDNVMAYDPRFGDKVTPTYTRKKDRKDFSTAAN